MGIMTEEKFFKICKKKGYMGLFKYYSEEDLDFGQLVINKKGDHWIVGCTNDKGERYRPGEKPYEDFPI